MTKCGDTTPLSRINAERIAALFAFIAGTDQHRSAYSTCNLSQTAWHHRRSIVRTSMLERIPELHCGRKQRSARSAVTVKCWYLATIVRQVFPPCLWSKRATAFSLLQEYDNVMPQNVTVTPESAILRTLVCVASVCFSKHFSRWLSPTNDKNSPRLPNQILNKHDERRTKNA